MDWAPGSRLGAKPGFDAHKVWSSACLGQDASGQGRNGTIVEERLEGRGVDELWSRCVVRNPNFHDKGIRGTDPGRGGDGYSSVPK